MSMPNSSLFTNTVNCKKHYELATGIVNFRRKIDGKISISIKKILMANRKNITDRANLTEKYKNDRKNNFELQTSSIF